MDNQVLQIAERIRGLRDISAISAAEMAKRCDVSEEEYAACEEGQVDFSFTFLYKCAAAFGVELTELLTGDSPKLTGYTVTRAGEGLPIKRREGFLYENLGYLFRDKLAEPYVVTAPYREEEQYRAVHQTTHEHQELDFILKGKMKFVYGEHIEILCPGDAVYYDSRRGHGMIATGGEDCIFLAVVIRKEN
ncbi:MAG: XRE family transcriptional regulator [Clostridiaceae bacterium]|nr:XRE family transcriptional regulator [Clostridiaceae bacterium]